MKKITVEKEITLKALFKAEFSAFPAYYLQKLCRDKDVRVNGRPAKEKALLFPGDEVAFFVDEGKFSGYTAVFENDDILVANKRRGVSFENLTEELRKKCAVYPVHRLDTNTAGLIVFAKNKEAEAELLRALKERQTVKKYRCRVWGSFPEKHAVLSDYLVKDAEKGLVRIQKERTAGALTVVTEYEEICRYPDGTSELSVTLHTGRTHQIRAHLAFYGHFVIGDGKYGNGEINRTLRRKKQELTAVFLGLHFSGGKLGYLDGKTFEIAENFAPEGK